MTKLRNLRLVGLRADGGNTLGSATNGVTVTTGFSEALHLVASGGAMKVRLESEDAAEDVDWPEDLPLDTKGFRNTSGITEVVPPLTITVPAAVTLTGWVIGPQPVVA